MFIRFRFDLPEGGSCEVGAILHPNDRMYYFAKDIGHLLRKKYGFIKKHSKFQIKHVIGMPMNKNYSKLRVLSHHELITILEKDKSLNAAYLLAILSDDCTRIIQVNETDLSIYPHAEPSKDFKKSPILHVCRDSTRRNYFLNLYLEKYKSSVCSMFYGIRKEFLQRPKEKIDLKVERPKWCMCPYECCS